MKRISILSLAAAAAFFTSCQTTREISLNKDGTGTVVTTTDMSSLIGIAKMSGQGKEMDQLNDKSIDTSFSLEKMGDSLLELSVAERQLVKTGKIGLNMNMADEKFITKLEFPFKGAAQLTELDKISGKVIQQTMKKQMAGNNAGAQAIPEDAMPNASVDDYFITTYGNGTIEKKLNKAKYDSVGSDKGMQAMKELSGQGMPMTTTIIYNLPSPAKKVEGVNAKLSDDKKKVTINSSLEDFFDEASKLEFKITY